jgi:AraC-like DNA-binding protein
LDVVFSTDDVDRSERLSSLRQVVCAQFLTLSIAPSAGSSVEVGGRVGTRELDSLKVARFSGSPITATRTRRHVAAAAQDDYLVALHTRGIARATQRGRHVTLRPGDLALLDSAQPYTIELLNAGPFEHIALRIPRERLTLRNPRLEDAIAVRVPLGSDAGRLASPYLRTLAAPDWTAPVSSAGPLIDTGLDLLVTAVSIAAGLDVVPQSQRAAALLQIKRYLISRLGDRTLSPTNVADAHYMSVRQLHRLFAGDETTFGTWIREERLSRCRCDLADRRLDEVPIADIARRWGYASAAHFSRAFTARFGLGPRDFRASGIHEIHATGPTTR